jgi:creatinine amidohydrolase
MVQEWFKATAFQLQKGTGLMCIASCEQHSRYLPLGTDGLIGNSIALDAAQKAQSSVLVLPTQQFGFSPHHRAFPGCITLSQRTMFDYLLEVFGNIMDWTDKLVILNSQGGNQSCLQTIVNELGSVLEKRPVLVCYWNLIADEIGKLRNTKPGGMGHAGELEVSLMMHYHPELVQKDLFFETDPAQGNIWHNPDMFARNKVYIYKSFDEYSRDGNIGQAEYASVEKGARIAQIVTDKLAEMIDFYTEYGF